MCCDKSFYFYSSLLNNVGLEEQVLTWDKFQRPVRASLHRILKNVFAIKAAIGYKSLAIAPRDIHCFLSSEFKEAECNQLIETVSPKMRDF